jgi:hypothetical protein
MIQIIPFGSLQVWVVPSESGHVNHHFVLRGLQLPTTWHRWGCQNHPGETYRVLHRSCTFAPLRILQKTLSLLAFSLWLLLFGMSLFIIWYHLMRAGGQHFLCQECYLAYLATPDCHTTCSSAPVWLKSRPSSEAKIADALASMAIHLEAQLGFVMGRTIW